jgi:RNA polymerase sigma-70 factor (ECF subfamily)
MYSLVSTKTDEELVECFLMKQDTQSFEEICARYTAPLYRYAFSFVRNKDEAEDIVQQTFIKVWRKMRTFDMTKKFSVWIYTIARRTALDDLKKRKNISFSHMSGDEEDMPFEETLLDTSAGIIEKLESLREVDAFELIISAMPEEKSEIIFLKLYEDMTFEEIAETVGRPMNTVKSVYRRSLEIVKEELEKKYHIIAPKDRVFS